MNKPILITGLHRSGTSWIGKLISTSPNVRYVEEPFNTTINRRISPLKSLYHYISVDSDPEEQKKIERYLEYFYKPSFKAFGYKLSRVNSSRDFLNLLGNFKARIHSRPLFKDPLILMSSEWMYEYMNSDIIICIRHPAAFVASIKVKNWEFDFEHFTSQPELMAGPLSCFIEEIEVLTKAPSDIIHQGSLLWKIIYTLVIQFKEKHDKHWYFVRNEDISLNPMEEFKKIFEFLKLDFTEKTVANIKLFTMAEVPTALKRVSHLNNDSWKQRLTKQEIQIIKQSTESVWPKFYEDSDW